MKPYILCKGPDVAYKSTGQTTEMLGYHAYFVTYIPFIPSFLSDDFTRMNLANSTRISLIVSRQIRFLNDLCSCKSDKFETFDLRFVSIPQVGQPYNKIYIFFIGKVFSYQKHVAQESALRLWEKFRSYFPSEDPFNYPLRTIAGIQLSNDEEVPSEPELLDIALNTFSMFPETKWKIVEIRKFEDRDPMLVDSQEEADAQYIGYFPHPFRPMLDQSAMSSFLETFARQDQVCVASICLRPTTLELSEQQHIYQMMNRYHALKEKTGQTYNWLSLYRAERIADIEATFSPLINQRNHLFVFKIQIAGSNRIAQDVVSALGSEIMNNSTNEPRMWSSVVAETPEEESICLKNFVMMEFRSWRTKKDFPLWRVSSLVTSFEAVGAFRLPIPPESGHLPGIKVKDEPFVTPGEIVSQENKKISGDTIIKLGKIIHRGLITETDYTISLSQLKRHGLITGSTGSGKTNTCLHILTELWKKAKIPFLVIYPIDKPDYRLLSADKNVNGDLLVFTLGDDTTSPFRFNPLEVPKGVLVRTYISLLMRTFSAAFSMWDPLPAVYRATLRRLYEEAGHHDLNVAKGGDPGTTAPLLSRLYELLTETADEMTKDYGREARGNIKQGSEIRIRDLLQNAGSVLNVKEGIPWELILKHPTVMEIGRVGSPEDSALIMGFLLMSLTSYLGSRRLFERTKQHHVTLIEEAHRLMSSKSKGGSSLTGDPKAQAAEDFANILAEVRGFNESILIAEQIPTELVSGAIGNTYFKIMHWLEEQSSYELFSEVMNLNQQQREYARTLPTGQAIVRGINARPILVQITNYMDQFQEPDDTLIIDDSDQAVNQFMKRQYEKFGLKIPTTIECFSSSKLPKEEKDNTIAMNNQWFFALPMQTCAFCERVIRKNICHYKKMVNSPALLGDQNLVSFCDEQLELLLSELNEQEYFEKFSSFVSGFNIRFCAGRKTGLADCFGYLYCYVAHRLDSKINGSTLEGKERKLLKQKANRLLLWIQKQVIKNWKE